jgi:hypothetical protein
VRRNLELIWLTGRLAPDFKTIADFRRNNGPAIRKVCSRFVALCRDLHLLDGNAVAIDGSKFKAMNHREKNFTKDRLAKRIAAIESTIDRYLKELDRAEARGDWRPGSRRQSCSARPWHRDAQGEARPPLGYRG